MHRPQPRRTHRSAGGLLLATLATALLAPYAAALDPERRIDQYQVASWSTADGLPHPSLTAVLQTRDGYLWLGTQGGLARFDGVHFEVFGPQQSPALRAASIKGLLESDDGTLWAGVYGGGLVRHQTGAFTAFGTEAGLPSLLVRTLTRCDGKIWVGTEDSGAALFDGTRVVERLGTADGLPSAFVRSLLCTRSGDLWIGTDGGGLTRARAGQLDTWRQADGLSGQTVTDLIEDRTGSVWVATTGGLDRFDDGHLLAYGAEHGLPSSYVFSLGEDRDGNLWVGTGGDGLARLGGGRFETLGVDDGLPNGFVWDLAEDVEGNLWVATEGGLARVHAGPFVTWGSRQGLADDQVRGILQARDGSLLIGTAKGLDRLSGGEVTHFGPELVPPGAYVWSLLETRESDLWLSTDSVALLRRRGDQVTSFAAEDGVGADLVWSLAEDLEGAVWAGTNQGGLARFANGSWTRFRKNDGLGANVVRSVLADRAGDVWAGTIGGGLSRVRGESVTTFTVADGLGSDTILALHEDVEGNLWVGTQGGGLSVRLAGAQGGRFLTLPADGFVPSTIGSFVEDDLGFLWMASNRGLRRAARKELLAVARGERQAAESIPFGPSQGLSGAAGAGFTPASWKADDGRLWFATTRGAASVDPRRLGLDTPPPPLVIESLLANHEAVDLHRPVVLPPRTFDVELHYTAPSFNSPELVRFRYRLGGFDLDWVEVDDRRTAYYTNLPPGRFRFEVTAANGDGAWNPVGATLDLRVLPHYYQTWWFKTLVILASLVALYALHRLRAGRLEVRAAVAEERNRLAREIHDTIAQDLVSILVQARVAARHTRDDPEVASERLERITALATDSLAEARSSLLALRSPALEGKDLASALAHTARLLAPDDEPVIDVRAVGDTTLAPAVEVELLRIGREAMTNAIRHGGARRVEVELALARGEARLRIADDGCGFDPEAAARSGGFGLLGMRERVQALGGTLSILSAPGSGTSVEAWVPAAGGMP